MTNFLINFHGILVVKWRNSNHHFIYQNSETPNIHTFTVTLLSVQQSFWSKIFWSATNRHCSLSVRNFLCKSHIYHLDEAFLINKNVFRFQVSVNDILDMKIPKSQQNLRCIENSLFLIKFNLSPQTRKQFPSCNVLKNKMNACLVLKNSIQFDDKRRIYFHQNFLLLLEMLNLFKLHDFTLIERFQCKTKSLRFSLVENLEDSAESSSPQSDSQLEFFQSKVLFTLNFFDYLHFLFYELSLHLIY